MINMNGRVYDPLLGRMLSPDAFVQNPGGTQACNRYLNVMNNPLKYTDPSGWLFSYSGGGAGNWNEFAYINARADADMSYEIFGPMGQEGGQGWGGGTSDWGNDASGDFDKAGAPNADLYSFWNQTGLRNKGVSIENAAKLMHRMQEGDENEREYLVSLMYPESYTYIAGRANANGRENPYGLYYAYNTVNLDGPLNFRAYLISMPSVDVDVSQAITIDYPFWAALGDALTYIFTRYGGELITGLSILSPLSTMALGGDTRHIEGNSNYKGPWTCTYRPSSEDPINRPPNMNYNNFDWERIVDWSLGLPYASQIFINNWESTYLDPIPLKQDVVPVFKPKN